MILTEDEAQLDIRLGVLNQLTFVDHLRDGLLVGTPEVCGTLRTLVVSFIKRDITTIYRQALSCGLRLRGFKLLWSLVHNLPDIHPVGHLARFLVKPIELVREVVAENRHVHFLIGIY